MSKKKENPITVIVIAILAVLIFLFQHPLLLVLVVVALLIYFALRKNTSNEVRFENDVEDLYSARLPEPTEPGFYYHELVGMRFHNLRKEDLGIHQDAVAVAQMDNPHDPYAVGIYNGEKLVAFVPRESNFFMHQVIRDYYGGKTRASYKIWPREGKLYGIAFIKYDIPKKKIPEAPAEVNPDNPFYNKTVVISGNFQADRAEIVRWLIGVHAVIRTSVSGKTDMVICGGRASDTLMAKIETLKAKGKAPTIIQEEALYDIIDKYSASSPPSRSSEPL